jgi:hypothetical protein
LNVGAQMATSTTEEVRATLHQRLLARRPEIEQTLITRVHALADPAETLDPEYVDGLRSAVIAALDFGLTTTWLRSDRFLPIPAALLNQARLAARNGIGLDTVLRRYCAGYTLLTDLLLSEAAEAGLAGERALQYLTRSQAALFDRLLAAVSEEYTRELESRLGSAEERHAERVQRLLDGELVDTSGFTYDFAGHHLGAVAQGAAAAEAIRDLARAFDRLVLLVPRREGTIWAWLGGRRRLDPGQLDDYLSSVSPAHVVLAIGEPSQGLAGWRLTHRQAKAALPIALRQPQTVTRYADVALLASLLQDDLLATSLRELYLVPLEHERDGGETLRETLRAYFTAEHNISSAAAALGVSRQAVANRLRAVEERLGHSLGICGIEVETALRLENFDAADTDAWDQSRIQPPAAETRHIQISGRE